LRPCRGAAWTWPRSYVWRGLRAKYWRPSITGFRVAGSGTSGSSPLRRGTTPSFGNTSPRRFLQAPTMCSGGRGNGGRRAIRAARPLRPAHFRRGDDEARPRAGPRAARSAHACASRERRTARDHKLSMRVKSASSAPVSALNGVPTATFMMAVLLTLGASRRSGGEDRRRARPARGRRAEPCRATRDAPVAPDRRNVSSHRSRSWFRTGQVLNKLLADNPVPEPCGGLGARPRLRPRCTCDETPRR